MNRPEQIAENLKQVKANIARQQEMRVGRVMK